MGRRDFLRSIFKAYTLPLAYLGGIDSRFLGENVYLAIAKMCNKYGKKYNYICNLKPRIGTWEKDLSVNSFDVAIVMQGPIRYEDDFTLNTIKYYRYIYPDIKIIVSTWKGVSVEFMEACKKWDVEVLLNDEPAQKDVYNLNYQLRSTLAGIKHAKSMGVDFVLKNRTDQRVLRYDTLQYFFDLLKLFPRKGKDVINSRLIFWGDEWTTLKYIPFFVCDFFCFGHVDDVFKLYDIPENKRNVCKDDVDTAFWSIYEEAKLIDKAQQRNCLDQYVKNYRAGMKQAIENMPETYIMWHFYNKYIDEIDVEKDDLLKIYQQFLKDYCIIIDNDCVDFYWPKYKFGYIAKQKGPDFMNFPAWLKLYMNNEKEFMGKE